MASGVVLLLALHCWAAPAAEKVVYLSETDKRLIKELVVAEVWRPGGAKSEALAEVLEGFPRSGSIEAASWLVREANPYFSRRLLDPTPFAARATQVSTSDATIHGYEWRQTSESLAQRAGINALSETDRFSLYHKLMAEHVSHGPFGMSYLDGCLQGVWENPREFLSEAERACFNPTGVWASPYTRDLGRSVVRLAWARAENRSMGAVLDLVEAAVKAEARPGELVDGIAPDVLLEEALLALLMDKQTKAVARLKRTWLAIPVADRPQGLSVEGRAALVAKGRMDSEPPRDTHAGRSLVRAIRALGDPTSQSKNLQFEESLLLGPEHSREELRHRGLLRAEPE
ncbi:MAG TPA: hypothetical protein P5234_00020 [Thermoanaerobaculaceae bacterium]|nr:hypothetical protein [Thermoanaerobaculaceae bacterium]HRS14614.1 hypothetical protein [Thermoanaerobaculaceae bacterium]